MTDIVNALLGPTGPQIGCDECFELLDAYVAAAGRRRRRRRRGSRDAHAPRGLPGLPRGARVALARSSWRPATMRSHRPARSDVVVVGGGVAAGACVSSLRDAGYDGTVTVVCSEPHPPYTRPGPHQAGAARREAGGRRALAQRGVVRRAERRAGHGRDRDRDRSGCAHRVRGSADVSPTAHWCSRPAPSPGTSISARARGSRARAAVVRGRRRHPPAPRARARAGS